MNIRKLSSRVMAAALVAGLGLGVAQAQDAQLPSAEFTYVGSWSGLTLFRNFEKPFWGEHIEQASDGQVTVDVTSFDQMGLDGSGVFRLLGQGVFSIGSTVADYTVSDAPALEGLDMPMIATDVKSAHKVVEAFTPVLADIMRDKFDAQLLAVVPYPPQVMFCNVPVSGIEDLQGKKIRASGRTTAEFVESLGASGITMSFSEVPGALQRGVIDCAISGSLSGYSAGWYEVAHYLYALPFGGWDYVVTAMNGETWDGLEPELQQWLQTQIAENYMQPAWTAAVKQTAEGVACLTGQGECEFGKPGNMELVEVTAADIQIARDKLETVLLPAWTQRTDDKWVQRWNDTIGKLVGLQAHGS